MARGKRYRKLKESFDRLKSYPVEEAISLVKKNANSKFDETVEISIRLGVDPKRSEQMVRGTCLLPYGTGKTVKVLVLTKGAEAEAKEAGADFVGGSDYIEKIKSGWLEADVVLATPDIMSEVAKLGKILGPRGLMPNPKTDTVTTEPARAVKEVKKGKIEFKLDKTGNIHAPLGKVSFTEQKMTENLLEFAKDVVRAKPPTAKGQYLRSVYLSSTMGPPIKLNLQDLLERIK